jgi:succinate dehydrogenase / fumarate reductase flavoprotein subunit
LAVWEGRTSGQISVPELRNELRQTMDTYCGVFRNHEVLSEGLQKVSDLASALDDVILSDHSRVFNTARVEALELENLMDIALATVTSALAREESRGAHSRIDFPERDDKKWLKHTLYSREGRRLDYKPVRTKPLTVDSFPPKARVY